MARGLIIAGQFGDLLIRQKSDASLELGELLVATTPEGMMLLQVFDLLLGNQLNQQNLELISGLKLEEDHTLTLLDQPLRSYVLARAKNVLALGKEGTPRAAKGLPAFFSAVRDVTPEDVRFLTKPRSPLFCGKLRSGSKVLDVPLYLDGEKALSHHILIAGTTGRGKSVLMRTLLYDSMDKPWCGLLVLDPHDEYYGRGAVGLKDHPLALEKLSYYTPREAPPGARTLRINLTQLTPRHFDGVVDWSEAQREALAAYYRKYADDWVRAAVRGEKIDNFGEATLGVVQRRLLQLLDLAITETDVLARGVFCWDGGETTIPDIVRELSLGMLVIIDTSEFSGAVELLIGSMVSTEVLRAHKSLTPSELRERPIVSIVLEEAPRVIGKDALERGPNVFSTIAREGRKFKVGLVAITQLPSLIPRDVLANLNTKIILGVELKPERDALIQSAAQDLSADERTIAALDRGEAVISSTFLPFAIPVRIPPFEETLQSSAREQRAPPAFAGVRRA